MQRYLWSIMALLCLFMAWTVSARAEQGVRINTSVICHDVVDRKPVAPGEVFARQVSRLYCWNLVVGATDDTHVTHNWYYNGALKSSVQLPVRSGSWRTWSAKSMDSDWTGEWMVEILSAEGIPLESVTFYVQ